MSRFVRVAFDRGGLIGALVLAVYIALAPTHVVDGDNAELATLGTLGGVAHPSGYPLYLIWLRLMAWLPGSTPAHTTAIATAMLAAAAVIALHAACRAWGARPAAATLAVAIYAAAPVVVRMSTEAEVFALNNLVAAAVLWLAARGGPLRGLWRAGMLGLVAGLGLSDHLTCALLAPIGILGVIRGVRESGARPRAAALAVAGLALGLAPYIYLVTTAESSMSWGRHIDGLHPLVHHFLRLDYGGAGAFAPYGGHALPSSDYLIELAKMLGRTWLWAPLAIGVAALVERLARPQPGEPRWGWAMLGTSFVLAGPLLATRFDMSLAGTGVYTVDRFFLMPALILAIPIAVGIDRAAGWLTPRRRVGDVLAAGAFVALIATSLPFLTIAHSPAVELSVHNMLRSLPHDAVALVSEDDLHYGAGYVQNVLGERRDVVVVMWTALPAPVYRKAIEDRLGFQIPLRGMSAVQFAEAVLARGRQLFVDAYQIPIRQQLHTYPYGILSRVVPAGTAMPSVDEVVALNKALYAKFDLDDPVPREDLDWAAVVHDRYAQTWRMLADVLKATHEPADAAFAEEMVHKLAPW